MSIIFPLFSYDELPIKVPLTMCVCHCQTYFCGRFSFNNFCQEPHLEFLLFSVKLFYCRGSKQARISGCCYVKYANSALSHLHIRQQLWKKQNHSSSIIFWKRLVTFLWQLYTQNVFWDIIIHLCTMHNKQTNHHMMESTHRLTQCPQTNLLSKSEGKS